MSNGDEEHADQLVRDVWIYQDTFHEWLFSRNPARRQELLKMQSDALERIYLALQDSLYRLIHGWTRSGQFRELLHTRSYQEAIDTLAKSVFGAVAAALPKIKIDPSRNVRGLLLTIARYDLYDQEKKIYTSKSRRRSDPQHAPESGDPEAAMWYRPGESPIGIWRSDDNGATLAEPEDPTCADQEEQVLTRDMLLRCWPVIAELWRDTLTEADWQIVYMRWASDPPTSFERIAQQIGPGWTMDAVKMRHYRLLRRTRTHLIAQQLADEEEQEEERGTASS